MTTLDTRAAPLAESTIVGFEWTPVVAGALAAAALAFVLHSFAIAIGLSVSSTAPTWRDTSFALVLLSGLYILLAHTVVAQFARHQKHAGIGSHARVGSANTGRIHCRFIEE